MTDFIAGMTRLTLISLLFFFIHTLTSFSMIFTSLWLSFWFFHFELFSCIRTRRLLKRNSGHTSCKPFIGLALLPLLTLEVISPATIVTIKRTLVLYEGPVYWFAPVISAKQLACTLQPISSLFLLDVYAWTSVAKIKNTLRSCNTSPESYVPPEHFWVIATLE